MKKKSSPSITEVDASICDMPGYTFARDEYLCAEGRYVIATLNGVKMSDVMIDVKAGLFFRIRTCLDGRINTKYPPMEFVISISSSLPTRFHIYKPKRQYVWSVGRHYDATISETSKIRDYLSSVTPCGTASKYNYVLNISSKTNAFNPLYYEFQGRRHINKDRYNYLSNYIEENSVGYYLEGNNENPTNSELKKAADSVVSQAINSSLW